ncbi:uncharacterized protein LOC119557698 [Drosophila subpulchrella]|uniref:uncharacterized protein LOC119557698 n=1 Tax=Drosophila subpulchrella TaxID=1486046 RepID=UPI0018A19D07|nr:uncharacterized protein LOC119557698 [Drosophila subpulchrella]
MSWIWSLFVLGFLIAQGRSESLGDVNEEVTKELKSYLENFNGSWKDNTEFLNWISKIRAAVKNNNTALTEKFQLRFNFETYNIERLFLEQQILDRIEELDSIIPHQKIQKCLAFYLEQRSHLKTALKQTNKKKIERFAENSTYCPYYNFDVNEHIKNLLGTSKRQNVL